MQLNQVLSNHLWSIIFGGLVCLLSLIYILTKKKTKNTPPEVKGWPIVGYVPALYPRAYKGFMKLKTDHPDIVTVHCGYTKFILIMSHKAMVETFIKKADNFAGRQKNKLRDQISKKSGIIFTDGPIWKNHRRFALRVLRDFGLGRNLSEEIVHSEVQNLLNYIDKKSVTETNGIDTMDLLLRSVSNVICTFTMGEQPGYEDEEDREFMDIVHRIRANLRDSNFKLIFNIFPVLLHLIPLMTIFSPKIKTNLRNVALIESYVSGKIQKHIDCFDPKQEPRDYIEAFLLEQYKMNQNQESHTFTPHQLLREIFELFAAGTDTTSNSLAWGLLLVALHKDVQQRCHEEIDAHIGRRQPTMKDKQSTPYILAVLDEVQRYATLVPMSLIHRSFEEDEVMGYTIPANSLVVPFIYGIHHDDKVWEKPFEFYPQHFLTKDGLQYQPREELVPFGVGRRSCLGESLARVELYLFFVSLLQRYTVSLNPKDQNRLDEIFLGSEGIILSPGAHKIIFLARN